MVRRARLPVKSPQSCWAGHLAGLRASVKTPRKSAFIHGLPTLSPYADPAEED